jgi:hypothetical protein
MWHRFTLTFTGLALLGVLPACTTHVGEPDPWLADSAGLVARVVIEPSAASLAFVDDAVGFTATALNPAGHPLPGRVASWRTSDAAVASVSAAGVVRAAGPGTVTLTATIGEATGTATLTVAPGLAVRNACTRCHWTRRPGGHFAWDFAWSACLVCHDTTEAGHDDARRDHQGAAGFVLSGAHLAAPCEGCHVPGSGEPTVTPGGAADCVACHREDYDGTHAADAYPVACLMCHDTEAWGGGRFDHGDAAGGYVLTAIHQALPCLACHESPTFRPRWSPAGPADCYACHADDYAARHAAQGYPTTCLLCHGEATWAGASFNHATASDGYALTGPHASLTCTACHDFETWAPKWSPRSRTDCNACHGD